MRSDKDQSAWKAAALPLSYTRDAVEYGPSSDFAPSVKRTKRKQTTQQTKASRNSPGMKSGSFADVPGRTLLSDLVWMPCGLYPKSFQSFCFNYQSDEDLSAEIYIYVIEAVGTGMSKVGIATDWRKRLAILQTYSPVPLRIRFKQLVPRPAARWIERCAHEFLSDHRSHGEWFRVGHTEAQRAAWDACTWRTLMHQARLNNVTQTPEWRAAIRAGRFISFSGRTHRQKVLRDLWRAAA